jgi:hypothetical protein
MSGGKKGKELLYEEESYRIRAVCEVCVVRGYPNLCGLLFLKN